MFGNASPSSARLRVVPWVRVQLILAVATAAVPAWAGPCDPPIVNPILCENTKPGNPRSEWDLPVANGGDMSIQGFATDISVNKGQTVTFKVKTPATSYRIDIYRLGYYGGMGARKITTVQPSVSLPQSQPACVQQSTVGLIDCGNWAASASWSVPSSAVSGVYIAKLVRPDTGGASHMVFVVRDDAGHSDILLQASDTTWVAYNTYGGASLYFDNTFGLPAGRAYKVSYNRPFITRSGLDGARTNDPSWVFDSEYPLIRWIEANGYNVSYTTGMDTHRRGSEILEHRILISSGHDEYWSASQRANVEAARDAGVNVVFFSGNEIFWKTRWENSVDGSNVPNRTMVCYKETHANAPIDPQDPPTWTGTWRDPRFSPPADGGRPENALSGTIFMVNGPVFHTITVPAEYGAFRFWRNTSIATLPPGETASLAPGSLGYEWDEEPDNGFRPTGLLRLSSTTLNVSGYLLDYGSSFGPGVATHNLTLYRAPSGALVFGSGTTRWSWGLDGDHDNGSSTPDIRMQQATVNLLADMGVQAGSLQSGLAPAVASTDTIPPASVITSPADGASVPGASAITISGTASDYGGGVVGTVDVSTDGGTKWHRATGRSSWSYAWTTGAIGSASIRSRAVDDSVNIETPSAGITLNVTSMKVTFNDLSSPNRYLNGVYPANEIDWGTNVWYLSAPWGLLTTNNLSYPSSSVSSATFRFVSPRRLLRFAAYNGGTTTSTVTVACAGNPTVNLPVNPGQLTTLSTGWTATCETVTLSSSNGWYTNFDDLEIATGDLCSSPVPVVCTALDACHLAGTCNPATGQCSNPPAPDGTVCDDSNPTTCSDSCTGGVCSGTAVAEPPAIGNSVRLDKTPSDTTISWSDSPGPYDVYRGSNASSASWLYNQSCLSAGVTGSSVIDASIPAQESFFYYLVSRVDRCRESVLGRDSTGAPIPNTAPCVGGGAP